MGSSICVALILTWNSSLTGAFQYVDDFIESWGSLRVDIVWMQTEFSIVLFTKLLSSLSTHSPLFCPNRLCTFSSFFLSLTLGLKFLFISAASLKDCALKVLHFFQVAYQNVFLNTLSFLKECGTSYSNDKSFPQLQLVWKVHGRAWADFF